MVGNPPIAGQRMVVVHPMPMRLFSAEGRKAPLLGVSGLVPPSGGFHNAAKD